ncbi:hypothetical protein PtB15_1B72 [Puccinia triticina]|nr:hypothetical protein PtB15_1B72 [Puccinia triticina]
MEATTGAAHLTSQSHDLQIPADLASARLDNMKQTAGDLEIPRPGEKLKPTTVNQHNLDSKGTFSSPTSSPEDCPSSPGTVSVSSTEAYGRSHELSIDAKSAQRSPEKTSQIVRKINSIYRELSSSVERPQAQLPEKSYWERLTTLLDQAKEYFPFGPRGTVTQFDADDEIQLNKWLLRVKPRLTREEARVLDGYYQAFSASSKKPTAMVKFDPDTFNFLAQWEEKNSNFFTRSIFLDFFEQRLSKGELLRRKGVLQLQQEHFRIVTGWKEAEVHIHQSYRIPLDAVQEFGKMLGGNKIFPAFGDLNFKEALDRIKILQAKYPALPAAWKAYLNPEEKSAQLADEDDAQLPEEYKERLKLLRTLSKMKNPGKIPPETISAWRAQGLDVNRMLKIVDYSLERNKMVGEGQHADPQLDTLDNYQSARRRFLAKNAHGTNWLESLEHDQLLPTSEDLKLKYLDLCQEFRTTPPSHTQPTPPKIPEITIPGQTPRARSPRVRSKFYAALFRRIPRIFKAFLHKLTKSVGRVRFF